MNQIKVDWVIGDGDSHDCIHTHGMIDHVLPELEIKNIPSFLVESATSILVGMCNFMIDSGEEVELNEIFELSEHTRFRFIKSEPDMEIPDHYEVERWQIVGVSGRCDCCGTTIEELN